MAAAAPLAHCRPRPRPLAGARARARALHLERRPRPPTKLISRILDCNEIYDRSWIYYRRDTAKPRIIIGTSPINAQILRSEVDYIRYTVLSHFIM